MRDVWVMFHDVARKTAEPKMNVKMNVSLGNKSESVQLSSPMLFPKGRFTRSVAGPMVF